MLVLSRSVSWSGWLMAAGFLVLPHTALASISYLGTATDSGTGGNLQAVVTFTLPGQTDGLGDTCSGATGTLCVTLDNTQVGTTNPADVLDSMFFSVTGNPTLTAVSALAALVANPTLPNSTNVQVLSTAPQASPLAGGWALAKPITGGNTGLPQTGYAWTTAGDNGAFNTTTLNINNDDYGVISGTTNSTGKNVVSNQVFFVLTGIGSDPLSAISGVVFTWDSAGTFQSNGTLTPEPKTNGLVALALLLGAFVGRKLRATAPCRRS
jgi:hypothetical protein